MARTFASASSQYCELTSFGGISGTPLTIAASVVPQGLGAGQAIVSVGAAAGQSRWQIASIGAGNFASASVNAGGTATSVNSTTVLVNGTRYHVCGLFTSSTSRNIYVNGANEGSAGTSNTPGAVDTVRIGARYTTSLGAFWDGTIAEVGVWSAALTTSEILSLARGAKPTRVRPQSLVFYAPLWGQSSPEQNLVGTAITLSGSPTAGDHPRVYY